MLTPILVILAAAIAGVLVYAATQPGSFRVERKAHINAAPERIFAHINDFRRWSGWSPYEKKDPAMKKSFSGAESGKGAAYAWDGNKDAGKGQMMIVDATPSSKITIKLDFSAPFEAHNIAEFLLAPEASGTGVTWAIFGPQPFMSKLMGVFLDMDKMIGKDFEDGLAALKARAEA